ncbi:hypothetical protein ASG85_09460 [Paenibacillus sp. Soil724D2]|nr:hypothetical protein ASG85_09460 [Paenibacillus sp. Soil724D2]
MQLSSDMESASADPLDPASFDELKAQRIGEKESKEIEIEGRHYLLVKFQSAFTGWTMLELIPMDSLLSESVRLREHLHRMRAYYYANITMINEKIGGIISALGEKGYLDNTVIIFT